MARHFRVRSFDKLQHYKDRAPPWIKLYGQMLDDYDVASLPDASKWHLVAIFLLASRTSNRIPWDEIWVASKIGARSPVDLQILLDRGFIEEIQDAPISVADRKHNASKALDQSRGETEQSRAEQNDARANENPSNPAKLPLADDPALSGAEDALTWMGDEASADRQLRWLGAILDELPERDRKPVTDFTRMATNGRTLTAGQVELLATLFQRHRTAIVDESNRRLAKRFPGLIEAMKHPTLGREVAAAASRRNDRELDRVLKLVREDIANPPAFLRRTAAG